MRNIAKKPPVFIALSLTILALTALIAAGCGQGTKMITLRFKYTPGEKLVYDLTQKTNSEATEGDSVISKGTHEIKMTIEDVVRRMVDDSTAEVLESSKWRFSTIVKNDSNIVDTNEYKREMVMYTNPNGKVVDVEFTSEMSESSMEYMRSYIDQAMPVFPSGEHGQGYSWTQTTRVLLDDEPVEASTTYEIKSFAREQGHDCVVISYDGNLVIPVKPNPKDSVQRSGVNRIQITGMMYFAYKEGLTVSNRDRWVVKGERTEVTNGKAKKYTILYEGDSTMLLTERKTVDPVVSE
jgi:hypothetical protein